VKRKSSALPPVSAMNGWPDAFWHIRQWQMLLKSGGARHA
jgi:hypothetical protein